jgi:signal transduction histidine kinase/DNA-binding NarL/FixJ family response regulator
LSDLFARFITIPDILKTDRTKQTLPNVAIGEKSVPSYRVVVDALEEADQADSDNTIDYNVYLKCFIHELRTPLQAISIGFDLLQGECTEMQKYDIRMDVKASFEFIENILTKFTIIQDSNIQLNPYAPLSIAKIIESVKTLMPRNLEYYNVLFTTTIHPDIHDWYMGDSHNLTHVIINLLKNSLKYQTLSSKNIIHIHVYPEDKTNTNPKPKPKPKSNSVSIPVGSICLGEPHKLAAASMTTKKFHIVICDNNPAILPHIKERLFQTFNSTSGSGLGLYICKTIVELHGGTISHEYIQPIGNKFIITLALNPCSPPPTVGKRTPRPPDRERSPPPQVSRRTHGKNTLVSWRSQPHPTISVPTISVPTISVPTINVPTISAHNPQPPSSVPPSSMRNSSYLSFRKCSPIPTLRSRYHPTSLPVCDSPTSGLPPPLILGDHDERFSICMVDDNILNCKMMYRLLNTLPMFDVMEPFQNGHDMISMMSTQSMSNEFVTPSQPSWPIDIVLLDKYMPDMDGLAVVDAMRSMKYDKLVFGLTGIEHPKEIQEFIDHGADFVFVKPLNPQKIESIITFLRKYGCKRMNPKRIKWIHSELQWV